MKFARGFNKTKTDRRERERLRETAIPNRSKAKVENIYLFMEIFCSNQQNALNKLEGSPPRIRRKRKREKMLFTEKQRKTSCLRRKKSCFEKQVLARLSLLGASSAALI